MRRGILLLALLASTACVDDAPARATLEVFAASSLTEAFHALERGFEAAHPDVDVRLTFAGSQVLRLQLEQGARADLFASADEDHMRALENAGVVSSSRVFARNALALIVPRENPAGVTRFEELTRAERIVIGTARVPVGVYTRRLLDKADFGDAVRARVVSEESNVRLVRAKVELGEADAAFVYRTDLSPRVRAVPIPDALNVRARYPVGVLAGAANPQAAARFLDFLASDDGRTALASRGFLPGEP